MTDEEIFKADDELNNAMFWESNEQILKDLRNDNCM